MNELCLNRRRLTTLFGAVALAALVACPGASPQTGPADTLWAYEAGGLDSRLLEYHIDQETSTVAFRQSCVPEPGLSNGRAVAFDPQSPQGGLPPQKRGPTGPRGILYLTRLPGATGDGLLHVVSLPEGGVCKHLRDIPVGDGPAPAVENDFGAADFDRGGGDLYLAGYLAKDITGSETPGPYQHLYRVDPNDGSIRGRCQALTRSSETAGGNDTLAVVNLSAGRGRPTLEIADLPPIPLPTDDRGEHRGKVLVTDLGEFRPFTGTGDFVVIDPASLESVPLGEPAPPCRIIAEFPFPVANALHCCTGIDSELLRQPASGPREVTVATDLRDFYDADGPPYSAGRPMGSAAPSNSIEDIALGRRAPPLGRRAHVHAAQAPFADGATDGVFATGDRRAPVLARLAAEE